MLNAEDTLTTIRTSNIRYSGADRLDITSKSGKGLGSVLAPTWRMVKAVKWGGMSHEEYASRYRHLILFRYLMNPQKFAEILSSDRTLVCYCPKEHTFCHRHLAIQLLENYAMDMNLSDIQFDGER